MFKIEQTPYHVFTMQYLSVKRTPSLMEKWFQQTIEKQIQNEVQQINLNKQKRNKYRTNQS